MSDFETHPNGTRFEISASRALAKEIDLLINQYGAVVPQTVLERFNELMEVYKKQMEGYYE